MISKVYGLKTYQRIILSVLSATFLFLSFKELGFFAWFSFIPFLFAITGTDLKWSILYGVICGIGFFAGMTYWLVELYVKYTWPIVAVALCFYFLVFSIAAYFILNRVKNLYIRAILIAAVWIFVEFVRSQTFLAFTIGIIGYSQHNFLPLMQITRFTGIYGVSFIVLIFNMAVYENIRSFVSQKKINFKFIAISLSLLVLFCVYGINSMNHNMDRNIEKKGYKKIEIAAVQPRVLFGTKYKNEGFEIIPEPYSESDYFKPGTELVIFSESGLWGNKDENEDFFDWAEGALKKADIWMLVGQIAHDVKREVWSNSLILYDSDLQEQGRYDEIHLVPFSQYMPHPEFLGFLTFLDLSIVNLKPGDSYVPIFMDGKGMLGFSICYESTLPYISQRFRREGAEVIIVASDDSSLNDSIAPWHHLIFSKTRAIENGSYVIHCANTGFSAIISPAGNFVDKLDLMDKGVLYGAVYLIPEKTFYAKYGNILLYIYLAFSVFIAIAYPLWKIRKTKKLK